MLFSMVTSALTDEELIKYHKVKCRGERHLAITAEEGSSFVANCMIFSPEIKKTHLGLAAN